MAPLLASPSAMETTSTASTLLSPANQVSHAIEELQGALREEREARLGEAAKLREALEALAATLAQPPSPASPASLARSEAEANAGTTGNVEDARREADSPAFATVDRLEEIASALKAESEGRCSRVAELHARLSREVSDLERRLEEQRAELSSKVEEAALQIEEKREALERALSQDREERGVESQEL